MPKRKYKKGQTFITQDKGRFVVLEHCPEKILLDSGKFKYRTKLFIRSELTGYEHWIMQAGLFKANLKKIDEFTFEVEDSKSFHMTAQSKARISKYAIGNTIANKDGVEFEILDRRKRKGEFGKVGDWILVKSKDTGYKRWRKIDKIKKSGGPKDTKTKVGKKTIINLNDPSSKKLPKKHVGLWTSMMDRCYGNKSPNEKQRPNDPRVCQEWLNLYRFHIDIQKLAGYQDWLNSNGEYHLDKDIKIKGNKLYSLDHCQFVPARTNIMYTANTNGCTVECVNTGTRYPSMAACARQNKVAYCTVRKHVNGKVKRPKWIRVKIA